MTSIVRGPDRAFLRGVAAMAPICVAAVPIGLVFGTLAGERGLGVLEAGLMSATVFAGAAQFVAIGLWSTPVPVAAIVLATFLVNLRHIMMGASLSRKMGAFTSAQRYLAWFGLADEVWALAEARAAETRLTPAYYAGLALSLIVTWVASTIAGAAFGQILGEPEALGLDFVFTAMFIALIVGFRPLPAWVPVALTSAAVSALTYQLLPSPWYVLAGSLAAMAVAALRARPTGPEAAP
jgi:4-azaleucine resistance transporter AzlC